MKPLIILLTALLCCQLPAHTQECKETLDISAESILKIFSKIEDQSIRGVRKEDGINLTSTVCLAGQLDATVFFTESTDLIVFPFLWDGSEEEALTIKRKLRKELLNSVPSGWKIIEDDVTDQELDRPFELKHETNKDYYLLVLASTGTGKGNKRDVSLTFNRVDFDIPCDKFTEILSALRDGSIRGAQLPGSVTLWETNIKLKGEIKSNINSSDYGKSSGHALANYVFMDGTESKKQAINKYKYLKLQVLLRCIPGNWKINEDESPDSDKWSCEITSPQSDWVSISVICKRVDSKYFVHLFFTNEWGK